jgi:integration host factor subunit alpha
MEDNTESVTKQVLADKIGEALPSLTTRKSNEIVESIIRGIRESLVKQEDVKISGFGKFTTHEKKARKGRNPQTGAEITIADRRVIKFKASDCLKAEINGGTFNGTDED